MHFLLMSKIVMWSEAPRFSARRARNGHLHVDPHGERVRSMVAAEVCELAKVLSITDIAAPYYFSFLGCGCAPETLMHIRQSGHDGTLPFINNYYGIDNRETASLNANAIFHHLGMNDCRALTMKAENFRPPSGATGIVLSAAYLHPAKADILDAVIANISGDSIMIVRNMVKGQSVFSESVRLGGNVQPITYTINEQLGVRSDFYHIPAA